MHRVCSLTLPWYFILPGLVLQLTPAPQHAIEGNAGAQEISVSQLEKLTLVNLGESYRTIPSENRAGRKEQRELTLKVGIRIQNISSGYVMALNANCFGMVNRMVFPEPVVGPIEGNDQFPAPDGSIESCGGTVKVVRVMPGKSYAVTKVLKFTVLDDVPSDFRDLVNPGVNYLQGRILVAQSWEIEKQSMPMWFEGMIDTELMRFTVKGKTKRRQVELSERDRLEGVDC